MYIEMEVHRSDFNSYHFGLFERGIQSLRLEHLGKEQYEMALICNKVFIYYNDSELVLKNRNK
jgi:hypothetical protein